MTSLPIIRRERQHYHQGWCMGKLNSQETAWSFLNGNWPTWLAIVMQAGERLLTVARADRLGTDNEVRHSAPKKSPDIYRSTDRDQDTLKNNFSLDDCLNKGKGSVATCYAAAPGRHLPGSPLVGINANGLELYERFAARNPALIRFGNALYFEDPNFPGESPGGSHDGHARFKMIPSVMKARADEISEELYLEYCRLHGVDPKKQIDWQSDYIRPAVTYICDVENRHNTWNVHVIANTSGIETEHGGTKYHSPAYLCALHELGHVERMRPHQKERSLTDRETCISEMAQVVNGVIDADYVFKKISGIPLDQEIQYPARLPAGLESRDINLGLIANTFRTLRDKYGTIEAALMSKEGMAFVLRYYSNQPPKTELPEIDPASLEERMPRLSSAR
jgi:hypothetical protein